MHRSKFPARFVALASLLVLASPASRAAQDAVPVAPAPAAPVAPNPFALSPAALEERRRMTELAAADRKRMMERLRIAEPGPLPPAADDPKRPPHTRPVGGVSQNWTDFKACVEAGPVYRLLDKKDVGSAEMPASDAELISGDIGYRMHAGGHSDLPDWPTFLKFADRYLGAPTR